VGVGVTAWSISDALEVIERTFGPPLPELLQVIEDVDVSALPAFRMGVPVWPGIWCPPINLWTGPP
jgi:hypothetical protein